MIRSMTGFARGERRDTWGTLSWELRSVNHRFLEPYLRLPEEFRSLDSDVRSQIGARLGRGKVDCALRYEPGTGSGHALNVDTELAARVVKAASGIAAQLPDPAPISGLDVLRWPGVVQREAPDMSPLFEAAAALLAATLDDLVAAREREGGRIAEMLRERSASVEQLVAGLRQRLPEIEKRLRDRLVARLEDAGVSPRDNDRLEQELVLMAQRMDVAEELDRLDSHVAELRQVLQREEPVGRRLDFLIQEFNREANTLGSKAQDVSITQVAVELKVLIEQMREQVQNVE